MFEKICRHKTTGLVVHHLIGFVDKLPYYRGYFVSIIATIALELGITIPYEEVIPQNFNSIAAMAAMLERLEEA